MCLSRVAMAEADVFENCIRTVLANSLYCRSMFIWKTCGGMLGVGAKESPFDSSCRSSFVN